jgi:hypothetical protein|tara:strand:- start:479 stop:679 length:201 start_codon:yes stop_codon:yes gene_type:complete
MDMKIKIVDEDTVLIALEPTRHYQLWNKWELYGHLLNSDKPYKFEVEDMDTMELKELQELGKKLMK